MEVPSCFLEIGELFGLIVSPMEIINTRKRKTVNIVHCLKSSKTMIFAIAKLRKVIFILLECHKSVDKSIDFYFFLLS